jgi:GH24 family phage-related lysozyme (muramidase)
MNLPHGWRWTVSKGHTVSAGVCETKGEAIRQAQTFIDAIMDWTATA